LSRAERKAETRARLIAVAREAFQARGYNTVTFRQLAADAGVSTGAFFTYFPSKQDLYAAALETSPPDVLGFLERLCADAAAADALERGMLFSAYGQEAAELHRKLTGTGTQGFGAA
jgi:AcrR family transcriptional regulator